MKYNFNGKVLNIPDEELEKMCFESHQLFPEDMISDQLYTREMPDVDLLIRPGGEYRISNFLLWQSAYAEFYFCDTLWPDFSPKELDAALIEFAKRNRRFGGL